jgi:hypothetical protein
MKPLIQREPAKYQPVTGMMEPIVIREFRGVNTFDPLSIADGFFTDAVNMTSSDFPAVSVRPGYTVLGSAIGSRVLGLGVWKDTELHAVFNDGTWRKWTGSAWTTLKSGLSTTATWSFTNFEGNLTGINLVGANGVDGLHRYDGATVQTFGDAPADINYVTTYQNRLFGASGKELRGSSLDKPDQWNQFDINTYGDEASYAKDIESIRGENINGLQAGMKKLTIGLPNSIVEMYGSIPSDFYTINVTNNEGFASNQSAFTHEGEMRFIHSTGLYEYGGGVLPDRTFSDIIRTYLTGITDQSAAGSDGEKMYFTIPTDKTMVYDPRSGVEAWHVWKDIRPCVYATMQNELYVGDTTGRVIKLGGASDAGTPISWYAITKPFTNRSTAQKQRWLKMWVMAELAAGSTLNISLSRTVDGNDWEQVHTFTGTGQRIERIMIPVANYALENTIRIKFSGTGWARLHEHTRQVRQLPLY